MDILFKFLAVLFVLDGLALRQAGVALVQSPGLCLRLGCRTLSVSLVEFGPAGIAAGNPEGAAQLRRALRLESQGIGTCAAQAAVGSGEAVHPGDTVFQCEAVQKGSPDAEAVPKAKAVPEGNAVPNSEAVGTEEVKSTPRAVAGCKALL